MIGRANALHKEIKKLANIAVLAVLISFFCCPICVPKATFLCFYKGFMSSLVAYVLERIKRQGSITLDQLQDYFKCGDIGSFSDFWIYELDIAALKTTPNIQFFCLTIRTLRRTEEINGVHPN